MKWWILLRESVLATEPANQYKKVRGNCRRLAQNKKHMSEEMNDLERKLHKEKKEKEVKSNKFRQLEAELREVRSEETHKSEISK